MVRWLVVREWWWMGGGWVGAGAVGELCNDACIGPFSPRRLGERAPYKRLETSSGTRKWPDHGLFRGAFEQTGKGDQNKELNLQCIRWDSDV